MGHARALITMTDAQAQLNMLALILKNGLSVREVERLIRQQEDKHETKKRENPELPEEILSAMDHLSENLDARVSIRRNNNGKGSVVINFTSEKDLKRILSKLNNK